MIENRLRKRLALIKTRARELSESYRGRHGTLHRDGPPMALLDAAPGCEHHIGGERFYLIRLDHDAIADDVPEVTDRFVRISHREEWPLISLIKDPGPGMARRIGNHQVCFLDIETTGLSPNTYVFLCGLMYLDGGRFVVEQLLARDYSEETGMLAYLGEIVRRYPMIVTFNGTGFDVPFLQTRMAVARLERVSPFEHVDLMDASRDRFANLLPNCRLETVEKYLRGKARVGDIPGREIPEAYHEFVRSGDARDMRRILYHNRMDLLAMAYIVNYLADHM